MDYITTIAYTCALFIGLSLGLIGSGGSILTLPVLVYLLGIEPILATSYSLFIVGSTTTIGAIRNLSNKSVDLKAVLWFGIPSILSVYITRALLLPLIPVKIQLFGISIEKNLLIMFAFAIVMLFAALKMIRSKAPTLDPVTNKKHSGLLLQGVLIGMIAATVGAGGGFLIIPVLVFSLQLPMKKAIGTSLCIITIQSMVGFLSDLQPDKIQWNLLLSFTFISIIGILLGMYLTRFLKDSQLKTGFGYFVLLMAIFIFIHEMFF
ncbi:sulfite exporter TauE/SafE family protein [Myroides sp. LJL110]